MASEVTVWKCDSCGSTYHTEEEADACCNDLAQQILAVLQDVVDNHFTIYRDTGATRKRYQAKVDRFTRILQRRQDDKEG